MSRAILVFRLPQEEGEFESAQKGGRYLSMLADMDNYLRARLKYEELPEPVHAALQDARDKLHECLRDYEVEI